MNAANGAVVRHHEKVSWSEIELLLNLVKNESGSGEGEILRTIGYASNGTADWRRSGFAPLRAKYSLLGLAAELGAKVQMPPPPRVFNVSELGLLLSAVLGQAITAEVKDALVKKLAEEISRSRA